MCARSTRGMSVDEVKFWQLVDAAHHASGGDMDRKCGLLRDAVSRLSGAEAGAFSALFDAKMDEAYTWALWGAAYVIDGGCSDDAFCDFRASLVSRGRQAFAQATADPDALAHAAFDADAWFYEGFQYAVADGV